MKQRMQRLRYTRMAAQREGSSMNWGIEDVMAALLLLLLLAGSLWGVFSLMRPGLMRMLSAVAVIVAVTAVWAHLAVGLI